MDSKAIYAPCSHIRREEPDMSINQEVATAIGREYRVMPMFEKGLFETKFKKHYSLHTNELLKCRWEEYKRHFEDRVFAPFQFLDIRDYHFYVCRNRLVPSESLHRRLDFRNKLKPGPGVDERGQMPIPDELLMKRGTKKNVKKGGNKDVKLVDSNDEK